MTEPSVSRFVESRIEQGVLVLTLRIKELQDEKSSEAILQEMLAQVELHRVNSVVVDLNAIKYLSSVAFRPFLSLRRKLKDSGGRLVLCGLCNVVGDVFYTTRLVSPDGGF